MVQGVTYPAVNDAFAEWVPPLERNTLSTITYSGAYVRIWMVHGVEHHVLPHPQTDPGDPCALLFPSHSDLRAGAQAHKVTQERRVFLRTVGRRRQQRA